MPQTSLLGPRPFPIRNPSTPCKIVAQGRVSRLKSASKHRFLARGRFRSATPHPHFLHLTHNNLTSAARRQLQEEPDLSEFGGQPYRTCGTAYIIQKERLQDAADSRDLQSPAKEEVTLKQLEAEEELKHMLADPMPPFRSVEMRLIELSERRLHPYYRMLRSVPKRPPAGFDHPKVRHAYAYVNFLRRAVNLRMPTSSSPPPLSCFLLPLLPLLFLTPCLFLPFFPSFSAAISYFFLM